MYTSTMINTLIYQYTRIYRFMLMSTKQIFQKKLDECHISKFSNLFESIQAIENFID